MSEENQQVPEFDVLTPDIPLPQVVARQEIADERKGAFRFSFIGSGQGGGRIAATFRALGYKRVCAINTARQDLASLPADVKKLVIGDGEGGAGKDPAVAKAAFDKNAENVLDLMRASFGQVYDRTIICVGAGGGTGAGTVIGLVDKARELQVASKCPTDKVGVIVALPKVTEGRRPSINAHTVLLSLVAYVEQGFVSPLIVLDNERMSSLYPGLAIDPFWDTANQSVCRLFDLFNMICVQNSTYTAFDPADYKSILDSGLIVFGATPVANWSEAGQISSALRDNLKKNILAGGVNLSTGTVAAAIVIAGKSVLSQVPHEHLDQAFDQLTRLLKTNSMVHRGIYSGNKDSMAIYTAIGGLAAPTEKLDELAKIGGISGK